MGRCRVLVWASVVGGVTAASAGCVGRLEGRPIGALDSDAGVVADSSVVGPDAGPTTDAALDAAPSDASGDAARDGGAGTTDLGVGLDMGTVGETAADRMCARWNADRADRSEGSAWSGSATTCNAGDMDESARDNAMKIANLYRFIAGLPDDLGRDPVLDQRCQEAALMMQANGTLSHNPAMSWNCYTADGALAASKANLSGGGSGARAVAAVDRYMLDRGENNAASLGHRRWILSETSGPWGFGSTSAYSCMYVINGYSFSSSRPFTAWPAPGPNPIEAWSIPGTAETIDDTGWSVQAHTLRVDTATATVTRDGVELPTVSEALLPNYGSPYALKITPQGWRVEAGSTYHVHLVGTGVDVEYDVDVVRCAP